MINWNRHMWLKISELEEQSVLPRCHKLSNCSSIKKIYIYIYTLFCDLWKSAILYIQTSNLALESFISLIACPAIFSVHYRKGAFLPYKTVKFTSSQNLPLIMLGRLTVPRDPTPFVLQRRESQTVPPT